MDAGDACVAAATRAPQPGRGYRIPEPIRPYHSWSGRFRDALRGRRGFPKPGARCDASGRYGRSSRTRGCAPISFYWTTG